MDSGLDQEKTSLWGVLHDGEVKQLQTSREEQTADLEIVVRHLNDFYDWPANRGIRFSFVEVVELKISQWVPDPVAGRDDIRSRRWSRREWDSFERVVPPHTLEVLEAALYRRPQGARLELAGYEHDVWLEIIIQGRELKLSTPDGACDVDRLIQMGDSYWDNFGKKRKR